jgi:hypothetical protein
MVVEEMRRAGTREWERAREQGEEVRWWPRVLGGFI